LRTGKGDKYLEQIKVLTRALANTPIQKILFISSTSVYPDFNRIVNESEDLRPYLSHNILLQAEDLITSLPGKSTTILRMSGLVGGSRHPGRFLAGKQNVPNPKVPVNLIHLDDCVNLIAKIFGNNDWGNIYNACADEHPTRQEFYTAAALKLNLPAPQFAPATLAEGFKIISNEKIKFALAYEFIHRDPMLFF
jgi:nucleoside-diphosphate-sugar epimerase